MTCFEYRLSDADTPPLSSLPFRLPMQPSMIHSFLSYLHLVFLVLLFERVCADQNVTVDDNDASIQYSDGWSVSEGSNQLDYGGYHHLSDSSTATAKFQFSGVAVYVMAPLWPYQVGAAASVDGSSPVTIDMKDPSRTTDGGSETVQSAPLWGMTGLKNASHTFEISFASGMQYVALDAIIYTVLDESETSSSSVATSATSSTSSPTASPTEANAKSSSHSTVPIIIGVVLGVALLAFVAVAIVLLRLRRATQARTHAGVVYDGARPDSPGLDDSVIESAPSSSGTQAAYGFEKYETVPGTGEYNPWHEIRPGSSEPPNTGPVTADVQSFSSGGGRVYSYTESSGATSSFYAASASKKSKFNGVYDNGGPPGQVTLSYGTQNPYEHTSQPGNIYTTQPLGTLEEKQALAQHYDAPPSYS